MIGEACDHNQSFLRPEQLAGIRDRERLRVGEGGILGQFLGETRVQGIEAGCQVGKPLAKSLLICLIALRAERQRDREAGVQRLPLDTEVLPIANQDRKRACAGRKAGRHLAERCCCLRTLCALRHLKGVIAQIFGRCPILFGQAERGERLREIKYGVRDGWGGPVFALVAPPAAAL